MSLFKYPKIILHCLVVLVSFSIINNLQASSDDPQKVTQQLIDALLLVKSGDDASFTNVDKFINYNKLTDDAIQPHKQHFNSQSIEEFKKDVHYLIRSVAYVRAADLIRDSKYSLKPTKLYENKAVVTQSIYVKKEDMDVEIAYTWQQFNDNWQLTDLAFDGDSIVVDYQNQFGRIINNEGVDVLMKKIKDKVKEIEQKN